MVTAEKAVAGPDRKPFLEYTAFDTFESLMGDQVAIRMYFQGVSRTKHVGNLGIGLLKPGLARVERDPEHDGHVLPDHQHRQRSRASTGSGLGRPSTRSAPTPRRVLRTRS